MSIAPRPLATSLTRLGRAVLAGRDEPPDTALLDRFLATRDGEAFAGLVARHGPMVVGTAI